MEWIVTGKEGDGPRRDSKTHPSAAMCLPACGACFIRCLRRALAPELLYHRELSDTNCRAINRAMSYGTKTDVTFRGSI